MSRFQQLFQYWGKTRPAYHPLPYHCLDVAATGRIYLERHHRLRRFLSGQLGLDEQAFLDWFTFFLALHDLGKFAETFQGQRPELLQALQGRKVERASPIRHDSLGYAAWRECVVPWLEQQSDGDELEEGVLDGLDAWARAVTGHHGSPPREQTTESSWRRAFAPEDQEAVKGFLMAMQQLLVKSRALQVADEDIFEDASHRLSWWLAGVAVLADWLGSNTRYFDFVDRVLPLEDYWKRARRLAARAVREAGVLPEDSAPPVAIGDLFVKINQATPLQNLAAELDLGTGPQLFVLEDVTGAGKTEAAVLLSHRLMAAGRAQGLYFALPTMATANAMYTRLEAVYRRLFAPGTRPSLVLAHGARDLTGFRQSILSPGALEDDYPDEQPTAGARCSAWLADSRKKALLAQMGAGTVDQALLGVLYSRHQCLRLLGLFGKVLIVDEVHANDPYMHRVLQSLLRFHAAGGGSAVLLSATLPQGMRRELVQAFRTGLGGDRVTLSRLGDQDYPLLTQVAGSGELREQVVGTRREVVRRVTVEWLDDPEEVIGRLVTAVQEGCCACWIRNTVADAREGYEALRRALEAEGLETDRLELFHARFVMGDRLDVEARVLEHFGPGSDAIRRQGRLLVATQVVEQSLDLDFDLLITDLAPIDLIVQRAGRLCRHVRDRTGGRLSGAGEQDQRSQPPTLVVFGPQPLEEVTGDWYAKFFPRAQYVYPNHARLWLTARLLREKGGFAMPQDARILMEGVYGSDASPSPEALDDSDIRATGEAQSKAGLAVQNSLVLEHGYRRQGGFDWWDDAITPTRLGEPQTALRLAKWKEGELKPWRPDPNGWDLSVVKLRGVYRTAEPDDEPLGEELTRVVETLPGRGKWGAVLPLIEIDKGLWRGVVTEESSGRTEVLYYRKDSGLLRDGELEEG
ncbi:MAG: CRISPR-associated helicase Cas3' [Candidatus Competibacteraceae bacterium]|nr:CRISPR-associated helicase Cas3' [Candidatus Competibacteraceae bacterium]